MTRQDQSSRERRRGPAPLEERERAAAIRDRLEGVAWGDVMAGLVATAHRMLGKKGLADAQDVASQAITQLLDPDYKDWNPEEATLEDHLASVAWGIVRNRRTSAAARTTVALGDPERGLTRIDPRGLEDAVATREITDKVFARLRARYPEGKLERKLVELFAEGIDLPRDQVRATGELYGTLYRARSRVIEEARAILAALQEGRGSS